MIKEKDDWKTEIGRVITKPKEIYELKGNCAWREELNDYGNDTCGCCWERATKRGGYHYRRIGNTTTQYKKKVNYGVTYWANHFEKKLDRDELFRAAVGLQPFLDYLVDNAASHFDYVECPFDAARVYRKVLGLLRAAYSWFGLSGLEAAEEKLRGHYKLQKEAW